MFEIQQIESLHTIITHNKNVDHSNLWTVAEKHRRVEPVAQRCSVKMVFLEISQNLQERTYARVSFLIKLQVWGLRPSTLLKKRLWHRCFPVNFVKFLRTPFYIEHLWWLLLDEEISLVIQKQKQFSFDAFIRITCIYGDIDYKSWT